MDDWESLAEEENVIAPKIKADINKWEGEDVDEDVKDSWEDEDEKKDEEKIEAQRTPSKSKPKKLNEKERKQLELEEKLEEEERLAKMTPEEKLSEKIRLQNIEKESDLKNALDTFGITEPLTGLDAMNPTTKDEFRDFAETLSSKITEYKNDECYPVFVEDLIRNISASLGAAELKKIKITIDNLHLEKQKYEKEKEKAKKPTKGKSKIKLRVETDNMVSSNVNDYGEGYDEYDDFM